MLRCTRGADLGPLVAPALSQQTNGCFLTGSTYLPPAVWRRALQGLNAGPALLAGVTHPRQWVWHSWLTLRARLCWLGIVFTSVDAASSCGTRGANLGPLVAPSLNQKKKLQCYWRFSNVVLLQLYGFVSRVLQLRQYEGPSSAKSTHTMEVVHTKRD